MRSMCPLLIHYIYINFQLPEADEIENLNLKPQRVELKRSGSQILVLEKRELRDQENVAEVINMDGPLGLRRRTFEVRMLAEENYSKFIALRLKLGHNLMSLIEGVAA